MKKQTKKEIWKAMAAYEREMLRLLQKDATRAYIAGDLRAHRKLGIASVDIDFNLVQAEALKFSKEYGSMLKNEGASIIQGKKIYWLKDHNLMTRNKIVDIINSGLKQGKPVTAIGGKKAVEGTIAYDLKKVMKGKDFEMARISRTEVGRIQNIGTLNRYEQSDRKNVLVIDDEGPNSCEECRLANGQEWTIAYARTHELEHPHCVRAFAPR